MSHADDLLGHARSLVPRGPGRPQQIRLRRAVSAAYYALFHLLTEEGAGLVCRGRLGVLRPVVRRMFDHRTARTICEAFVRGRFPRPWDRAAPGSPVPKDLVLVAETFVLLQEKRHSADYDLSASFSRKEVEDLLERVTGALDRWRELKGREPVLAGLFLLALLFGERVRR